MESNEEDDVEFVLQVRTAGSLQQKWSKSVQLNITKFVSLTNRYPIKSGEGKVIAHLFIVIFDFFSNLIFFIHLNCDCYYNRIHLIYLEQYPGVKSFDIYGPSFEISKYAPKFQSIVIALNAGSQVVSTSERLRKQRQQVLLKRADQWEQRSQRELSKRRKS